MEIIKGGPIDGVETGNAWDVQPGPEKDKTGWVVGFSDYLQAAPLRFMPKDARASEICVKWFVHKLKHDKNKGKNKPISTGRSISFLTNTRGKFRLRFWRDGVEPMEVILNKPGDFAAWGDGVYHEWEVIAQSTIMTVRWIPDGQPHGG